jgi:5-methylcytosine-specific restriction endonuclease McrA
MRKVLLLNLSEEVLGVITWKDAIQKLCRGVARRPYGHTEEYEIQTCSGVFRLPTAIVLVQYIHLPYKRVALTAENLLKRDNHECQYCGKKLNRGTVTMDHVFPESRGGKKIWKNIVAACKVCNNSKDNKTPSEAGMKLRNKPEVPSQVYIMLSVEEKHSLVSSWDRWLAVSN